jgi:hypothetical protein
MLVAAHAAGRLQAAESLLVIAVDVVQAPMTKPPNFA